MREQIMFRSAKNTTKRNEDVKKSAAKVLDTKKDTATRAKHLRLFLDNSEVYEVQQFFDAYYSHVYYIVYEHFIATEQSLRQKGAHKAQREEFEIVLYLVEKVLIFLPEALSQRWQYHSIGRLMSKLLHPGNSWKLLKKEAMRLFLLWYSSLGDQAGDEIHAIFATLVPGFSSPFPNMGLTALATQTHEPGDGPVGAAPILPIIPPQSAERWKNNGNEITRIFNDVLLELMVSQVVLVEWREDKLLKQKRAFNFLLQKYKCFYIPAIFPNFNWQMSIFKPSLELPEVRKFRPNFIDTGDGTKKMDPMLACRVVVIKWIAQYTHLTRGSVAEESHNTSAILNISGSAQGIQEREGLGLTEEGPKSSLEGQLVREVLYGNRANINFVHEVYRQAFLLSFSHSPAMKKVITVYKDWIQMNVQEVPPFLLEPSYMERNENEGYYIKDETDYVRGRADSYVSAVHKEQLNVRAGLQNLLQLFVTNAANVFLLEVSPEYPILLEEQVEMCKRVLNIYRYMVMNVKMDGRTWEQLLFILLQITQLTLVETPPRRREDTLGGRLAQAIFQTLIVTWIKANLYVVVSCELWDQFLEVLSSLTLWEELVREWFKTMETLTRVLARQVYSLDLNDLPLDRLTEQKAKRRRGKAGAVAGTPKVMSGANIGTADATSGRHQDPDQAVGGGGAPGNAAIPGGHPAYRDANRLTDGGGVDGDSPYPERHHRHHISGSTAAAPATETAYYESSHHHDYHHHYHHHHHHHHEGLFYRRRCKSESVLNFSRAVDEEMLVAAAWRLRHRRSRSVGSLRGGSRGEYSRSISPALSSSMESHSIKDSPIQLDHDSVSEGAFSEWGGGEGGSALGRGEGPRSVMAGGTVKGWLPDVAVVLWRRMLGSLGDVNAIADTVIHAQIYKYLIDLHEILVRIRANQGVSLDNLSTPPPPSFVPPFTIFAPWCFRALLLPDTYQRGKMYALRLLCLLTVRPQDTPLPRTHLIQFYKVLHRGLCSSDPDTVHNLVRFTGSRFFSLALPGYSAFLFGYLAAANSIITSQEFKGIPRTEAVSIVGSLLSYPPVVAQLPLLLPDAGQLTLVSSQELQDQVIGVLLKAGKKEPNGLARCIALSSLGIFVYRELAHETFHPKLKDAIFVLLAALKFNNKAVAQVASDMLLLLSEQVEQIMSYHLDLPKRIVEVLSRSLASLLPKPEARPEMSREDRRLLLSLLSCLGEWCMQLPLPTLVQVQEDGKSLLHHVFEALLSGVRTSQQGSSLSSPASTASPVGYMEGFDPDISVDDLRGEPWPVPGSSNVASPLKAKSRSASRELLDDVSVPLLADEGPEAAVQLAARTLLNHLVNHLNHFPGSSGAASLSSQVSEQDDMPGSCGGEELSMDTLQSPSVQLFILNNTTLLSLVEIPGLEDEDGAGQRHHNHSDLNASNDSALLALNSPPITNEVRIILRDISGKFVWDTSFVSSPPPAATWSQADQENCRSPSLYGRSAQPPNVPPPPFPIAATTTVLLSTGGGSIFSPPRHTKRHRPPGELPTHEAAAPDLDQLDDLLQYLGHTAPELLSAPGRPLNTVAVWPVAVEAPSNLEGDLISSVIGQRNLEQDQNSVRFGGGSAAGYLRAGRPAAPPELTTTLEPEPFQQARILFQQLGLSSWEKRPHIQLVKKTEQLVRELKNLDNQKGRETHKIAVIYVAEGQEDKISILSNTCGSQAFEEFVAGMGWEVELEHHTGFIGGLTRNKTTGETAPYYATSFTEIMFHVSTRMNSSSEESMLQKTRHLGNDEIHIVWSEHWRDYRRGIIPTEFCDVLIVIYPLKNRLFRIQVIRKPEVPFFGPLYNEMIVDQTVLPGLVRATAVNASRAKRAMMPAYKTYYEERAKALDSIIEKFRLPSTFEEFVVNVYNPSQTSAIIQGNTRWISTSSTCNSTASREGSAAAALLDPGHQVGGVQAWGDEARPRAHTEYSDRLRLQQLGDGDNPQQHARHRPGSEGDHFTRTAGGMEHTPLRKKVSVGGLAPTSSQLHQGGWATHQQQQAGWATHQQQQGWGSQQHQAQQQVAFSQIPLSDDEDPSSELSQRRPVTKSSPLINVTSVNRRPLAVRQNSGGPAGGVNLPLTRKR